MKNFLIAFILLVLIIAIACNDENTDTTFEGYGIVLMDNGLHECPAKIILDNGLIIIPENNPDFKMATDDRVWVEYEIIQKQTSCEGQNCRLLDYQVIQSDPYIDLYFFNYDSLKQDPVKINEVTFEGKCLVVNLSYSGGCEKHVVDLARLHPSCGTPPLPPPTFEIRHDSKNDPCEAWVTETYRFDMAALADEFDGSVKIILQAVESEDSFYSKELMINFD